MKRNPLFYMNRSKNIEFIFLKLKKSAFSNKKATSDTLLIKVIFCINSNGKLFPGVT